MCGLLLGPTACRGEGGRQPHEAECCNGDIHLLVNSQQTSLNRLQAGLHQHTSLPTACISVPWCRLHEG